MSRAHSMPCIAVPPTVSGIGSGRSSRPSISAAELAIDLRHVGFAQGANGGLQPQAAHHEVVIRLRENEARLENLLLLSQDIEIGTHADLEPQPGRFI